MRRRWKKGKRAQGTGFPVVVSSVQEYLTSVLIWNRATPISGGGLPCSPRLQRDESSRTGDAGNDPALVRIQWRASVENDEPSGMIGPRPLGADGGTRTRTTLRSGDFKSPASAISPHRLPGQSPQLTRGRAMRNADVRLRQRPLAEAINFTRAPGELGFP